MYNDYDTILHVRNYVYRLLEIIVWRLWINGLNFDIRVRTQCFRQLWICSITLCCPAKFNRFKILKKLVEAGAGMSICGFSVARMQEVDYMCTSNVFEMYKMYSVESLECVFFNY